MASYSNFQMVFKMKKLLLCLILFCASSSLADSFQIIRDSEIENNLKAFMEPLVKAAKLNPQNINIIILADPSLNAFVTNGTDMFINSGLIIKFADDPNVLYGVMAHEIAHIYAGHLVHKRQEHENMSNVAMAGTVLGLASALAGAPDAGAFIGLGSMQSAQRGILQYSRAHETEADKIAVDLLYKTHNNGLGLIKFFQYISQRDRSIKPDPYAITHPLSNDRIASVRNSIKDKLSQFGDNITPQIRFEFKRMAVKLEAFLGAPDEIIRKYKNNDYALAIGYFRYGKLKQAITLLDKVIAQEPNNPYLWELKGQFCFDNGIFDQANQYYQKALKYVPNDSLIKVELAAAKINLAKNANDTILLNSAVSLLNQVTARQQNNIMAYFMLSLAYGKLGDQSKAILALAEYYFYIGGYEKSRILANKVLKMTSPTSREYLRASDIIDFAKSQKD